MSKRIIHISDLHIKGRTDQNTHYFEQLLNCIFNESEIKPIIIITGDIFFIEGPTIYQPWYKEANRILKTFYDQKYSILPVPGNHEFTVFSEDDGIRHMEVAFHEYILEPNPINEIKIWPYPHFYPLDDHKIFFIGVNSVVRNGQRLKFARGNIGEVQRNAVKNKLIEINNSKPDYVKILYLHHHPFYFGTSRKCCQTLIDGNDFMKDIADKGVDIMLFGHENWHFHNNTGKIDKVNSGIKHILSCSDSTNPNGQKHQVDPSGFVSKECSQEGCFGWEIEIDDRQNINITMLEFDLKNNVIIRR